MTTAAEIARRCLVWPSESPPCALDRALRQLQPGSSWAFCRRLVETGKVTVGEAVILDTRYVVHPNDTICINPSASRLALGESARVKLVHYDAQIVVADKPPGISTVPFDASERGTFDELVRRALSKIQQQRLPPLGIVHRIDKETSGLVVFARTTVAKRHLKQQFRFHTNHRAYLGIALGTVEPGTIRSRLVPDRGDGRRGSTDRSGVGQNAITHVEVLERLPGATLVRCRLETGRTHQIRIHLAEAGHPLLGERVYGGRRADRPHTGPRLMLHAAELGIDHPTRELRLDFSCPPPPDFDRELARLRNAR